MLRPFCHTKRYPFFMHINRVMAVWCAAVGDYYDETRSHSPAHYSPNSSTYYSRIYHNITHTQTKKKSKRTTTTNREKRVREHILSNNTAEKAA